MEKNIKLTLYDLQIRDACYPLYLMQLTDVMELLDGACSQYVKELVLEQNSVSGKDLGNLSQRSFEEDDQESIPLRFIISEFIQNYDWKNLLEQRPGN